MKRINTQTKWMAGAIAALCALVTATSVKAETLLSDFGNNFFFDDMYASWAPQAGLIGGPTNWAITATDFGGAVVGFYEDDGFTPKIVDASADEIVEFEVTIVSTNVMGPQLLLEDQDGTRLRYSWYGLPTGTHKLVNALAAGAVDLGTATGSVAGLDLTKLVLFHVQMDDGGGANTYTFTLENLRTLPAPPPPCHSLVSDFNNAGVNPYAGSSWEGNVTLQPTGMTVTATGFGGGWQSITPAQLVAYWRDVHGALSVVRRDPMPGLFPGMDFSKLKYFHVQIDDGGSNHTYTVSFDNLRLYGFNPTIADFSFDPAASEFDLVWNSRSNRTYSVAYVSDLNNSFSIVASNIVATGTSTTNTVTVPAGHRGFLKVVESCQ